MGLVGRRKSGSDASHRVWVTTVTTWRSTPARRNAFCSDC